MYFDLFNPQYLHLPPYEDPQTCLPLNFMFSSKIVVLLITPWVWLVLILCTCVWGHPSGEWPIYQWATYPKKSDPPSFSHHQ